MKKFLKTSVLAFLLLVGSSGLLSEYATKTEAMTPPVVQEAVTDPLPDFAEPHLVFHYFRNDGLYNNYALWVWGQNQEGNEYTFPYLEDTYGKYFYLPVANFTDQTQINFLIKSKGDWSFQTPDVNLKYADYTLDATTNAYHFYLINGSTRVFKSSEEAFANQISESVFTSKTKIRVVTNNKPTSYSLLSGGAAVKVSLVSPPYNKTTYNYTFIIDLGASFVPDFEAGYEVKVHFENGDPVTSAVGLNGIFDDPYFAETMTYDGDDLGVTYTPSSSIFKAWAPTVSDLKLRIYENGTPVSLNAEKGDDTYAEHQFVRGEKGVWSITLNGDLHGKYYTFVATHPTGSIELTDPYAKSAGINGVRGMIVDFSKTNPTGWNDVNYSVKKQTEIIPYELHVADLTADDTWNGTEANRKKFLGLIEEGTTYTKDGVTVKTGFDHIKELGVNALQIIPFYDQQNDERNPSFNWGYNPQNYDVLEGSYSSDPYDGLVRIREFKEVVKAYAAEDIRIIMDVVYNHVASLSAHSFTKLVPGYYFRYTPEGAPDNSSGVGNVTASERIMMERFMRDSTAFWVEEYKIGGFRFDLMGLHTTQAMNTLRTKAKTIREDIFIIGEAWDMDKTGVSSPATQKNIHNAPGVGAFNDQIRDALSPNNQKSKGWVQLPPDQVASQVIIKNKIRDGMLGKIWGTQSSPEQTVNYVACHDNNTLYDKIVMAGAEYDQSRLALQSLQADTVVLLSQGVSFIHAGSEILRSKPLGDGTFDHNSYQSPYEVNSIKWDEKITNLSVFSYYQQLIAVKRDIPAFQYTTREDITSNVTFEYGSEIGYSDNVIRLTLKDQDHTYTVYIFAVGSRLSVDDLDGKYVLVDTSGKLEHGQKVEGSHTLATNTTIIVRDKAFTPIDPVDPTDPNEPKPTNLVWLYITLSVVLVAGAGVAAFFLLRKKKVS
ncbi:MAG: type I pullulanase [Bacilli bacterium]|nr:type I pullulanase [Bacilli bacterium]